MSPRQQALFANSCVFIAFSCLSKDCMRWIKISPCIHKVRLIFPFNFSKEYLELKTALETTKHRHDMGIELD